MGHIIAIICHVKTNVSLLKITIMSQTNSFNEFKITSFVATEPEVRTFTSSSLCRFAMLIARSERHGEETTTAKSWLNFEMWRKDASSFADIKKGARATVTGFFKPNVWNDGEGVKHNATVLVATKFELVPKEEPREEE